MGRRPDAVHKQKRTRNHRSTEDDTLGDGVDGGDGVASTPAETMSRRRLLRASAGAGIAVAGVASIGTTAAATSGGDVIWTYGETELECSPPPETFEAPLTVVNGRVYAGTTCTHIHVIDSTSGEQAETIYTNATTSRAPSVVNDIVTFAPNNDDLKAYDYQEEEIRSQRIWETDVGGSVTNRVSAPTVYQGTAYTTNHDGPPYFHAVDLWTGDVLWSYDEHELGEAPVVVDGMVYVSGRGGMLVALDADSGDEVWVFDIGETSESAPTVADGTVYVGSDDDHLYAVDASTGDEEWRFDAGGAVTTTPTVADGVVYVGSTSDTLYAVDVSSGDELWRFDTEEWPRTPTVAGGAVFVSTQGAGLFALDTDGNESWHFAETELDDDLFPRMTPPIVVDGVVYVATTDGQQGRVRAIDAGIDGSSVDSRVMLGTNGHHEAWAETAAVASRPSDAGEGSTGDDDGAGGDGSSTDGLTGTDSSDGGGDDGLPGPGIVGALASLGGVAYWAARRTDEGEGNQ
ncbi:PQQ-binding-like beta-propeller repeat protein [Halobacteria archaeon AArc-curdl1]|uniref:PQQ-binding-like beta-propeller repeat protein n=1 Tax=Natronosalvus hydrolyticus TaxID=2979988 RepID=A0AAP2Z5X2_9EURY|nr:PQQ-binding-like beta-propeller repeat protein [Halobacteria archaeon AArc-curdl1]